MARISYKHPQDISDPEMKEWLNDAITTGRPGPENQAIRAHNKVVMRSFTMLGVTMRAEGVLPQDLRELREVLEYVLSIGLAFFTGLLLGRLRLQQLQRLRGPHSGADGGDRGVVTEIAAGGHVGQQQVMAAHGHEHLDVVGVVVGRRHDRELHLGVGILVVQDVDEFPHAHARAPDVADTLLIGRPATGRRARAGTGSRRGNGRACRRTPCRC